MTDITGPVAAEAAGISYRQLDWWITHEAVPHRDPHPGSGHRRSVPEWFIPRLRLMGKLSAQTGQGGNGGLPAHVMRQVFDNYETGRVDFDGFAIIWQPEPS
jgi:hypothetical protein